MARRLPKTISDDQFERVLRQASRTAPTGIRNRAMLVLMYDAGLRVSEASGLAPSDIRQRDQVVQVRHGKGDKDRVIPLSERALDNIDRWFALRGRRGPWLFCTLSSQARISDRYVRAMVSRYSTRADVLKTVRRNGVNVDVPLNPHQLRHSAATRWLNNGFNIEEVRQLLGHASLSTTQVYLHANPAELAAKMRTAFPPREPPSDPLLTAEISRLIDEALNARHAGNAPTEPK